MKGPRIAVIRLGAMGDVIHALPAVATLKHSFPRSQLCWVIDSKWRALVESNPFVDEVIAVDSSDLRGVLGARRLLSPQRFDIAVDIQGLIKSAFIIAGVRAERIYGFHYSQLREKSAALFYSHTAKASSPHVVDRNLELAAAAGATSVVRAFPIPAGWPEGDLPEGPFVLASPIAGWEAKQWPLENYADLARRLEGECGVPLVLNAPSGTSGLPDTVRWHFSGLSGLIDATRRAAAVVGVDSGPLHLAAALSKPGVAIYGPTNPERNGPYGGAIEILRAPGASTSHKRRGVIDSSMRRITVDEVLDRLKHVLACRARAADVPG